MTFIDNVHFEAQVAMGFLVLVYSSPFRIDNSMGIYLADRTSYGFQCHFSIFILFL